MSVKAQEEWRPAAGFAGRYEVSSLGRVRSVDFTDINGRKHNGRIIKPVVSLGGYAVARLFINGQRHHKTVHRMVAHAFLDNPDSKSDVNHINGNKLDNRVENLEWATRSENILHAYRQLNRQHGVPPWKGAACPYTRKLTDEQADAIRSSDRPVKQLANEYEVSRATIWRIRTGQLYNERMSS